MYKARQFIKVPFANLDLQRRSATVQRCNGATVQRCNGATVQRPMNSGTGPRWAPASFPLRCAALASLHFHQIKYVWAKSKAAARAERTQQVLATQKYSNQKKCLPCFPCHMTFQLRTSDGFDGLPARFFFTLFWANRVCVGQHLGIQHGEKPRHFDSTLIQDCLWVLKRF